MASVQQQHRMNGSQRAPPIETKVNMDKDYDYYIAKYNSPAPPPSQQSPPSRAPQQSNNGNLGAVPMEPGVSSPQDYQQHQQRPMRTPPRPPAVTPPSKTPQQNTSQSSGGSTPSPGGAQNADSSGDEALLDLAQLEELHHEAERMKALGNKHMAAQVNHLVFSLSTILYNPIAILKIIHSRHLSRSFFAFFYPDRNIHVHTMPIRLRCNCHQLVHHRMFSYRIGLQLCYL